VRFLRKPGRPGQSRRPKKPRRRKRLLVPAVAVALIVGWAGYAFWFRDLSLLRVRHVEVSGLSGPEAGDVRRALTESGRRMTTLHVRRSELMHAVEGFASVRSVTASADFPTTLHVRVEQYVPVAALVTPGGRRVAASADGTLLGSIGTSKKVATVKVDQIPSSRLLPRGVTRTLVLALGDAPASLRPVLERAFATREAIEIPIRSGPTLYFGKPERLRAKWAAAARVLADQGSSGARFIDLRLPERPAATTSAPGQHQSVAADAQAGQVPPSTAASAPAPSTGANPQL
jgi:cell division protein FtsQ